ncbi:UNVERIFIED_CONTAM: hypothetical protein FKN15_020115 [Acipenser sinensis]
MKTTERLLQSSRSRYRLTVTARDKGPSPLEASAVVHVQIIPVDKGSSNNAELIIRHFVIKEDSKPGKVIGSLKLPNHPNESNQMMDYSIAEGDGSVHFGVDRSTGDLHLSYELDYETASHYLLKVQVEDHSQAPVRNTAVFVSVTVEDVNDHSPWFLDDFVVIGIQENLPAGSWVYTFNAKDGDGSLPNSALRYYVTSSSMEETAFVIDPVQGTLTTTALLDREDTDTFILTVTATDQAVNLLDQKTCSLTAKIVILDVNDNSPVFVSSHISYVMEDAEVGSLVHHTIAQDKDEGRNGRVTYSVLSGNEKGVFLLEETTEANAAVCYTLLPGSGHDLFTINSQTGEITTKAVLDREVQDHFSIRVLARDSGLPALSSTATVLCTVLDLNDNTPEFILPTFEITIPENQEPGIIYTALASDEDAGENGIIEYGLVEANAAVCYTLLPGSGHDLFTINSQTGEITTKAVLDREVQDHFSIRVLARDSGLPALSSTATVLCTVLDLNDNTPEFILPTFEITIPENQEPGIIYTALASDEDAGENGIIEYGLVDENAGGYFVINSSTGALSATKALDREERCNYTIVIEAHDLGTPQRSSTAELRITVLDVNDNSPEFSKTHYRTSVSEDLAVGSEVLQLTATDKDEGSNGEVMYSLIDDTFGMFTISSSTGTVMTTMQLDRETKSQYVFQAVANDCSTQGPRSSTVNIMVHIEDINDNAPVFIQNPVNGQVSMETALNQTIATVRADDSDLGQNGAVVFSFAEPDLLFDINRQTGDIWLKSLIPSSEFGTKVLHVIAADQGIPMQYSSGLVIVHLQGEETGIWFTEPVYKAAIPENSKSGSTVVTVTANDRNKDTRKIKYSIFSGNENEAFTINADTGDISIKDHKSLDFEMQDKIHLVVLAENTWKTVHCRITITIQDVNDNPPRFEQSYYKTAVWEGQIHNTYIMQAQLTATTPVLTWEGEDEHTLSSEACAVSRLLFFTLRTRHAATQELQRRRTTQLLGSLQASLQAPGQTTGVAGARFRINLLQTNNIRTKRVLLWLSGVLLSSTVWNQSQKVFATDADSGLNGQIEYSILSGNQNDAFLIDTARGIVATNAILDREIFSSYKLILLATDKGSPQLTATTTVRIQVVDVNDNAPAIPPMEPAEIAESEPASRFVP